MIFQILVCGTIRNKYPGPARAWFFGKISTFFDPKIKSSYTQKSTIFEFLVCGTTQYYAQQLPEILKKVLIFLRRGWTLNPKKVIAGVPAGVVMY